MAGEILFFSPCFINKVKSFHPLIHNFVNFAAKLIQIKVFKYAKTVNQITFLLFI